MAKLCCGGILHSTPPFCRLLLRGHVVPGAKGNRVRNPSRHSLRSACSLPQGSRTPQGAATKPFGVRSLTTESAKEAVCGSAAARRRVDRRHQLWGVRLRRGSAARYPPAAGCCVAGSMRDAPRNSTNRKNSDGWQMGSTTVTPKLSALQPLQPAILPLCVFSCLRQRRSGGRFLQL